MSSVREIMQDALELAFTSDLLGQEVLYQGTPVQAIFRRDANPKDRRRSSTAALAELQVMVADVPVWVYNDEVIIDGVTWKVKSDLGGSNWFKHVLSIETDLRVKP